MEWPWSFNLCVWNLQKFSLSFSAREVGWCIKITRGCNVCGKKTFIPQFGNENACYEYSNCFVSHMAYWGNKAPWKFRIFHFHFYAKIRLDISGLTDCCSCSKEKKEERTSNTTHKGRPQLFFCIFSSSFLSRHVREMPSGKLSTSQKKSCGGRRQQHFAPPPSF